MKYQFGSAGWLGAVHGMMAYAAAAQASQSPESRISICEVYLGVPAERGGQDGRLAWSCVSEGGRVTFDLCERDDVDIKVSVDFALADELARLDASDPIAAAELARRAEAAKLEGKLVISMREPQRPPAPAPSIHDLLARMTA
jgi:hypothetical protein